MKTIIYILIGLILIGTASAIQPGQILTQDQINGVDMDTVDLHMEKESVRVNHFRVHVTYKFYSITPTNDGTYEVIQDYGGVGYSTPKVITCINTYNRNTCITKLNTYLKTQALQNMAGVREALKRYQQTLPDITISDIDLT